MRMVGAEVPVMKGDGSTNIIPVVSQAVVYTQSFDMSMGLFFGVWLRALSLVGTPDLKVELQESFRRPTTEGAADDDWGVPDGFSNVFDSTADQLPHQKTMQPIPRSFGRYKITGLATNSVDTTVRIYNFIQEQA